MTIFTKNIKNALLGLILGVCLSVPAYAGDDDVCAPFEDAQIDKV